VSGKILDKKCQARNKVDKKGKCMRENWHQAKLKKIKRPFLKKLS